MNINCTKAALQRIAKTLNVPEDTFLLGGGHHQNNTFFDVSLEQLEIINLFQSIQDPLLRRSCLDFVREIAAASAFL
ncbi:hypothetical protein [Methylobacterium sp. E-066]|uniref:hypothetical protein n=1 Tax=Methylobacterium sp. E-066 TaxID=2836584 RepID=UPI001FBA4317|nr:hypothetical protein [Methylobacterium sp. E-066]MCJ2139980.1 hypothetical protein [Methylobacterium sp. E-066]